MLTKHIHMPAEPLNGECMQEVDKTIFINDLSTDGASMGTRDPCRLQLQLAS